MGRHKLALLFVILTLFVCCSIEPNDPKQQTRTEECADHRLPVVRNRRLSNWQLKNKIRSLFGETLYGRVYPELRLVPSDRVLDGFIGTDVDLSAQHAEAYFFLGLRLAMETTSSFAQLKSVFPGITIPCNSTECQTAFVNKVGYRLFARPLTKEQSARYAKFLVSENDFLRGSRNMLAAMLQSPYFTYYLESPSSGSEAPTSAAPAPLDDFALASLVAYSLTGHPPDDRMLENAEDGTLGQRNVLKSHVERLLFSENGRRNMSRFFGQWVGHHFLETNDSDRDLARLAKADLDEFFARLVFIDKSGAADLFRSSFDTVFMQQMREVWQEERTERYGFLQRPGFLLSQQKQTDLIGRGTFIAKKVFCHELAQPASLAGNDEMLTPPPITPDMTGRERWERATSGENCRFCHALINPFGFALEEFDSQGRRRNKEAHYDNGGLKLAEHDINTATEVFIGHNLLPVLDSTELTHAISESTDAYACFEKQWLSYALSRPKGELGCLEGNTAGIGEDRSIVARFTQLILSAGMSARRVN